MRHSISLLCVLAMFVLAPVAFADEEAAITIEPGKWRFRSTSKMPMSTQEQKKDTIRCVKNGRMTPGEFLEDSPGCVLSNVKVSSSAMSFDMKCSHGGGTTLGSAEYRSEGKKLHGKVSMTMKHGGMSMAFDESVVGDHLGPCDD